MTSHRDHNHPATPAARAACRKNVAHLAALPPTVGDSVMVWLCDAPSEMPGVVTWINESGSRYGVRMTRSGNTYGVSADKVRKP